MALEVRIEVSCIFSEMADTNRTSRASYKQATSLQAAHVEFDSASHWSQTLKKFVDAHSAGRKSQPQSDGVVSIVGT